MSHSAVGKQGRQWRVVSTCRPEPAGGWSMVLGCMAAILVALTFSSRSFADERSDVPPPETPVASDLCQRSVAVGAGISEYVRLTGAVGTPGPYVFVDYESYRKRLSTSVGLYSSPLTFYLYGSSPNATLAMLYGQLGIGGPSWRAGVLATGGIWNMGVGASGRVQFDSAHERRTHGLELKTIVFPEGGDRTVVQLNLAYSLILAVARDDR